MSKNVYGAAIKNFQRRYELVIRNHGDYNEEIVTANDFDLCSVHTVIVKFDENSPHCTASNERYSSPIEMRFFVINAKLCKLRSECPGTAIRQLQLKRGPDSGYIWNPPSTFKCDAHITNITQIVSTLSAQYFLQLIFVTVFVLCYWGMVYAMNANNAALHFFFTFVTGFALMITMIAWDFAWDITTVI